MNILLGLTGSVASVLYMKLIEQLSTLGSVTVIVTANAKKFIQDDIHKSGMKRLVDDNDEWFWGIGEEPKRYVWAKNDPILHITLRDSASALVIAPCSANTLAKLSNGICDNLLTSVARAWHRERPLIFAPAMNNAMWGHRLTEKQTDFLEDDMNYIMIPPIKKTLACGDTGIGAMAEIDDIVKAVEESLRWQFPLSRCNGIPVTPHPGAFLAPRKGHIHTGVDLYTTEGQEVFAMEDGVIVSIEPFTGAKDNSPWWRDTEAVLVEGRSGVICYGEITPYIGHRVGQYVGAGGTIGHVKRVIHHGKEHPEITGHSPSMLHVEFYPHGTRCASNHYINVKDSLRDPTPQLLKSSRKSFDIKPITWEPQA